MKRHVPISCVIAFLLLAGGCSTVRPLANGGHDLVENAGWPWWVRGTAGLGALTGLALATPVTVVLFPEYVISGEPTSITTSQGYGLRHDIPTATMRPAEPVSEGTGPDDSDAASGTEPTEAVPRPEDEGQGDIRLPLALAPLDYGGGIGAGIVGAPFRALARLFRDAPPPPEGAMRETPDGFALGFEAGDSPPRGASK